MVKDVGNIEKPVSEVREILSNEPSNTAVELDNLSENSYNILRAIFEQDYIVRGIINILRVESNDKNYILHISRRQENA